MLNGKMEYILRNDLVLFLKKEEVISEETLYEIEEIQDVIISLINQKCISKV